MLDRLDAERALRPIYPEVVVEELIVRTGGENSAVYQVRCGNPAGRVIIKIYPERFRWKLGKEVHVYRLLGAHDAIPVPRVLFADGSGRHLDHGYLVMSLLDGEALSEVSPRLGPEALGRVYRRLGGLLAAFHRIGQPGFGYLTTEILDPVPTNARYMRERFENKLAEFTARGGDTGLREAIERFAGSHAGAFAACPGAVLCHNDFYEGNILVARTGDGWDVTGVIDVENAIAADPLLDIAKTEYYSIHGDPVKTRALLDGYGTPPATWPAALPLYRLYHALELWDWYALIGNDAPLGGLAADMAAIVR
jgi:aminoglycoside phosphotransferase (APT) family kinase protein